MYAFHACVFYFKIIKHKKHSLDGFNNGLNAAEERIRSKENIQNALQRDNKDGDGARL